MGDTYGGIVIPPNPGGTVTPVANPPIADEGIGDPLLQFLGSYLQTILNVYGITLWQQVMPGTPLVVTVKLHDPTKDGFVTSGLPALYVYRSEDLATQVEWVADDYRSAIGQIHIVWVPPDDVVDKRRLRVSIGNLVLKLIDSAVENDRDPQWIVTGDTDPQAAANGSQLLAYTGAEWFDNPKAKWIKISLPMQSSGDPKTYDALQIDMTVRELLLRDITRYAPSPSVDATYVAPDGGTGLGPLTLGEQLYD